jgi:hypothetical protein
LRKGERSFPLGKLGALSLSKRQLAGNGILPWPCPRDPHPQNMCENLRWTRRQDADKHGKMPALPFTKLPGRR